MRRVTAVLLCALFLFPCFIFAACAETETAWAYPEPEVLEIDLYIQPYHFLQMISTTEKKKHPAIVRINGEDAKEIGIQIRGSSTLRVGMMTPQKRLPLELCFDWADARGRFLGNSSLKLINSFTPARLITQVVAMQAFAFLGIEAPRLQPAFIRINDVDFGLYLAAEDVNDTFVQRHFGGGSLFRPYDGEKDASSAIQADGAQFFAKTDPENTDLDSILRSIRQTEDLEKYLDTDQMLRYFACEAFLYNTDGFSFGGANYYLQVQNDRVRYIPWDEDDVFGVFVEGDSLSSFEAGGSPLFHKMMQNETYYAQYRAYVRMLNEQFLNPETFLPWLDGYIHALEPYLDRDQTTLLPSADYVSDLTQGDCIFNTFSGNLARTFREYHAQLAVQLTDETAAFFVPEDMTTDLDENTDVGKWNDAERSAIIVEICRRYWSLRRSFYFREYGRELGLCGGAFVLIFVFTVVSVYVPKRTGYHRRKEEKLE